MKKLTFILVALLVSLTSLAKREMLDIYDLGAGDDKNVFNGQTATIAWKGDWSARGWWFSSKDCSEFSEIVLIIQPVSYAISLKAQYNNCPAGETESGWASPGATKIVCPLNSCKGNLMQAFILCDNNANGKTLQLVDAYLSDGQDPVVELNMSSTGELTLSSFARYEDTDDVVFGINVIDNAVGVVNKRANFWDIGWVTSWDQDQYAYLSEGDPEGLLGEWKVPVGFLKQVAKLQQGVTLPPDHTVDEQGYIEYYGKKGVVIATYNGAMVAYVKVYRYGLMNGIPSVFKNQSKAWGVDGGIRIADGHNEKVTVFSIDGRQVKSTVATDNFISLERGIYLVKIGIDKPEKVLVK